MAHFFKKNTRRINFLSVKPCSLLVSEKFSFKVFEIFIRRSKVQDAVVVVVIIVVFVVVDAVGRTSARAGDEKRRENDEGQKRR